MAFSKTRKLFLNLPVKDLPRSRKFFEGLGFAFSEQFCDDKANCMVVSDEAFVMLLTHERFADFAKKPLGNVEKESATIVCVSAGSRAEVDEFTNKAIETGGKPAAPPVEMGTMMYGRSFYDPDGHHWEVMWMDPAAIQGAPEGAQ